MGRARSSRGVSAQQLRVSGPHVYGLRPESDIGGEVYERNLLSTLPEHGVSVHLGLPRDHAVGELPSGWSAEPLRHRVGLHWTRAAAQLVPYVVRRLRSGETDVLRGHSVRHTGPALLLGRALARSRTPIVLHHHHLDPRWSALEAAIAGRADAVITVSDHARAALIRAGVPAQKLHVVLEGVARPAVTDGLASAWPLEGMRLLYLGRLELRKRPAVAIDALARVRAAGVPASLLIAGEGPIAGDLRRDAQSAGMGGAVRFRGRVSEAEKWQLYDAADVLLFASTLEGFGLVVAEAQSRGVPVVAAAGAASSEAFDPDRSGLATEPDGEAFARAILQLADQDRHRRMSAHARDFSERFDWDRCAAAVADVYRGVGGIR